MRQTRRQKEEWSQLLEWISKTILQKNYMITDLVIIMKVSMPAIIFYRVIAGQSYNSFRERPYVAFEIFSLLRLINNVAETYFSFEQTVSYKCFHSNLKNEESKGTSCAKHICKHALFVVKVWNKCQNYKLSLTIFLTPLKMSFKGYFTFKYS